MITTAFVCCIAAAALIALTRWRRGIFLAIVVGVLQDPVRKLTPDAPAIMALCALPIWLGACVNFLATEKRAWLRLRSAWPQVAKSAGLFLLWLLPATLMVFQYGLGAWRMAVIGLFGYLVPLASMVAGFTYVQSPSALRRLLTFYCLFTCTVMPGGLLQYLGAFPDWPALGTEALGMQWIRYMAAGQVDLISGFYRSPDIMGWHAAMLVMLALTLTLQRGRARRLLWLLPVILGLVGLLLAGRRKMIMMPAVWVCFVIAVYLWSGRAARVISLLLMAAVIGGALYFASGEIEIREEYYAYATSTVADAPQRVAQDAWGAVWSTYAGAGVLGRGIGSASQGTQHIGLDRARGWQESGLSKLAVELGLPGLLCGLLVAAAVGRACLGSVGTVAMGSENGVLQLGLLGVVVANAASFVVSHQVYGDAAVMVFSAFVLGITLSANRWAASAERATMVQPAGFRGPWLPSRLSLAPGPPEPTRPVGVTDRRAHPRG